MADDQDEDEEFMSAIGPIKIDWPRAVGYYGAVGIAVALDVIAPPLGWFIAAVPLVKLLKRQHASRAERIFAAIVEGAGKPVGGDAEAVVRPTWLDEQKKADEAKTKRLTNQTRALGETPRSAEGDPEDHRK